MKDPPPSEVPDSEPDQEAERERELEQEREQEGSGTDWVAYWKELEDGPEQEEKRDERDG